MNEIFLNKNKNSLFLLGVIAILVSLTFYFSPNFLTKKLQAYQLNKEFVCPETQTREDSDVFLYRYIEFYKKNYPEMTLSGLLGMRTQLLVSHNCVTTLQNLAANNNGIMPDENTVNELKNAPYGPENPTLKEILYEK